MPQLSLLTELDACCAPLNKQGFAESLGIPFLETSAKNASNVEEAFLTMTSALIKMRETKGTAPAGTDTVKVRPATGGTQSSGGCC